MNAIYDFTTDNVIIRRNTILPDQLAKHLGRKAHVTQLTMIPTPTIVEFMTIYALYEWDEAEDTIMKCDNLGDLLHIKGAKE